MGNYWIDKQIDGLEKFVTLQEKCSGKDPIKETLSRVYQQREKILEAFIAETELLPSQCEQVSEGNRWWVQKRADCPALRPCPKCKRIARFTLDKDVAFHQCPYCGIKGPKIYFEEFTRENGLIDGEGLHLASHAAWNQGEVKMRELTTNKKLDEIEAYIKKSKTKLDKYAVEKVIRDCVNRPKGVVPDSVYELIPDIKF